MGGHFSYPLSAAFFPDYKKHGVKELGAYPYDFSYEVNILSDTRIANISLPGNAVIAEKNEERTDILIRSALASRSVDLFYRTADMLVPQLHYAESEDGTDFAVSASLVPTFDPVEPQDFF